MSNFDTQNDDYFDNHYQFSQGILNDGEEDHNQVVQSLVFSKCQRDTLSTEGEYKHRRVLVNATGEYCPRCKSRHPLSLKILSCIEILKHKELTKAAAPLLPAILIEFLVEVGLNVVKKDDWNMIKNSIAVLLEYWPYKELDLTTLTDNAWQQVGLAHSVLDRFAAGVDSAALKGLCTNQFTEFVMKTTVEKRKAVYYRNLHRKLFTTLCDEKRRWIFDYAESRIKYIITTDIYIYTENDLRRILYMLRFLRKPGSPFEVRIVNWHFFFVKISDIAKIFLEINHKIVKSISVTIEPKHILKLDKILKPCVELASLTLSVIQGRRHLNGRLQENLANDVSLLISHHPTIKELEFFGFQDMITGYGDKYRLPTLLETLKLYNCCLTRVDWEHWANASTTSSIRELKIAGRCLSCVSDADGLLKFVKNHAETLVSLEIRIYFPPPTMDILKRMIKHLAKFNTLQSFTFYVEKVRDMLEILRDITPSIAVNQSLNSYSLSSDSALLEYDKDFLQSLQAAMMAICIERRRLLDFATVTYMHDEDRDGIPLVDYEELRGVPGYQNYFFDNDCKDDDIHEYVDGDRLLLMWDQ